MGLNDSISRLYKPKWQFSVPVTSAWKLDFPCLKFPSLLMSNCSFARIVCTSCFNNEAEMWAFSKAVVHQSRELHQTAVSIQIADFDLCHASYQIVAQQHHKSAEGNRAPPNPCAPMKQAPGGRWQQPMAQGGIFAQAVLLRSCLLASTLKALHE